MRDCGDVIQQQQQRRTSDSEHVAYPTPLPTNHKPQRSHNQQIHDYENVVAQAIQDGS